MSSDVEKLQPPEPIRTDTEPNQARPTREPVYRGVRRRSWGRYVSEIRIPKMKTRIWLGSFESAEMAARAHDSAAIFFKGKSATLNFPHLAGSLPQPHSSSRRDIQIAAAKAALQQPPPPTPPPEKPEEEDENRDRFDEMNRSRSRDHGGSSSSGLSTEEGEVEKGWWFLDDELASFFGDDDLLKPSPLMAREYYRFDGEGESCLLEEITSI